MAKYGQETTFQIYLYKSLQICHTDLELLIFIPVNTKLTLSECI
jgi:hypothetical protein